jgi:hypothetical protein
MADPGARSSRRRPRRRRRRPGVFEGEGVNEGTWVVPSPRSLMTQEETARAGVSGVGSPESPASRHRSLRRANPGVSGLPRVDQTRSVLGHIFERESMFEMVGVGLGQRKFTEWYLVLIFAKCN